MKGKILYILISITAFAATCKKGGNGNGGGTVVTGKAELYCEIKHHFYNLANCKVYIKKGLTAWPGKSPSFYDAEYKITDANGLAMFDKLANDNYVIYAIGYDAAVADTSWGYNFITINNKPGEVKEYNLVVPVSETH
jgi:hypothetical protein